MNKHVHGFSLIELMIVLVIVGILGTVAMGFFGDNVISANRTEARSALAQAAGSLEKCKSLFGGYDNANCNVTFPIATDSNYYSITSVVAASTFSLTATPVAGQPQAKDSDCTTFTLTNTGLKDATGGDTEVCW
ncbi:MAG: prepilin-type N-terminal cleavage/methylation domain-containing protein [Gammaproteobacteria bacterium]|nr:prepilin-type N-terminal cleavage/methylation domain-containing protein [Gammaproteobacteria bacterium]